MGRGYSSPSRCFFFLLALESSRFSLSRLPTGARPPPPNQRGEKGWPTMHARGGDALFCDGERGGCCLLIKRGKERGRRPPPRAAGRVGVSTARVPPRPPPGGGGTRRPERGVVWRGGAGGFHGRAALSRRPSLSPAWRRSCRRRPGPGGERRRGEGGRGNGWCLSSRRFFFSFYSFPSLLPTARFPLPFQVCTHRGNGLSVVLVKRNLELLLI